MYLSTAAKAEAYLTNFPNAVLPQDKMYKKVVEEKGMKGMPTEFTLFTAKNLTLRLKPINSFKHRGLILRFCDYLIPRPLSQLTLLDATILAPEFKTFEILEYHDHDILIVLDT